MGKATSQQNCDFLSYLAGAKDIRSYTDRSFGDFQIREFTVGSSRKSPRPVKKQRQSLVNIQMRITARPGVNTLVAGCAFICI